MNICIFNYAHISKLRGGVERVTTTLATELASRGHNIYQISAANPIGTDSIEKNQFVLPDSDINSTTNATYVRSIFKEKKIDIILNQTDVKSIFDLIIETHKQIPIVSCIHTDPKALIKATRDNWDEWRIKKGIEFWSKYPYFLLRIIYQYYKRKEYASNKHREYYKKCDAIVLLSERFKESFRILTGITDTSKLYAINNPNPYNVTNNMEFTKEKTILFVGRLEFQKRVDRLLRIWEKVQKDFPDWKLKIIGNGTDKSFLEDYSKKLDLYNVEFSGALDPEDDYKRATILCMTSSLEGSPCVIQEALLYNVIPIAFKSFESVEDVIDNNINGFTIEPFSIKAYTTVLKELMSNFEYRNAIHENIKNSTLRKTFDIKVIADKWEILFNKLVQQDHSQNESNI